MDSFRDKEAYPAYHGPLRHRLLHLISGSALLSLLRKDILDLTAPTRLLVAISSRFLAKMTEMLSDSSK